jgi:PAS domain S-box-containing protein
MKTILLVEDEAIIAMTEANTLKKHGFEVITVYNAEKAIEAVQKHPIDLILMDIDLGQGKMDGTESAQIILKKHELPIVFLTSHTEKEIVDKVKGITRYGYVVKNSGEFVLIESINMAFELFNANQNIREREQRYRSLFFNNHSPMLLIRPSTGEIIEANPAACEFYRWTKEELTRMKIQDINQLSNVEVFQEMQKAEEEKRNTFYFKHRLADGTIRDVEVRASPISIQGEDLLYSIVNDITEKREAEANLQITLDSIGDAVISTDLNERIVQMNPVAETLTGWKRTEAVGEKVHDVFYIVNSSHEVLENPVNTVLTKGTIVELGNHTKLISRDGTEHHIADSAAPIQDSRGKIKGVVLVFRDVTDRKN